MSLVTYSGWSLAKFVVAACFVFVTTADDAVWLIPVISPKNHSPAVRMLHCAVFICVLQFACLISWLVCMIFGTALVSIKIDSYLGNMSLDELIQIIGMIVCWTIAVTLFIRRRLKVWRRQAKAAPTGEQNQHAAADVELCAATNNDKQASVSLLPQDSINSVSYGTTQGAQLESTATQVAEHQPPRIWFVVTMTLAGAADEMMCFPALLLGHSFSIQELSMGCLAASAVLVLILLTLHTVFKPVFDLFDRIPLYAVVAIFATIQTVSLIYR